MQRLFPMAILSLILLSCQAVPSQAPMMATTAPTSMPAMTEVQALPEASNDQGEEIDIPEALHDASELIQKGEYQTAIVILDKVVAQDPENMNAHLMRATAYTRSSSNIYETQLGYYVSALQDIDKTIALAPTDGNNYANREFTLRALAALPPDRATRFALYELANESADKAIALGVIPELNYVYRHHARNLIESNHCEEGLEETKTFVGGASPDDPLMGLYNVYLTEAYLCLGDLDEALKTVQKIQCSDVDEICRTSLLAAVYYQSGDLEKALTTLNDSIDSEPAFNGWRYFLRALIYYDQGERDLAMQDIETGKRYSWSMYGPGWYVSARLAFDDRDDNTGMLYLQNAESTLDPTFELLRQKVLAEIEERGGEPLELSPQIPPGVNPTP